VEPLVDTAIADFRRQVLVEGRVGQDVVPDVRQRIGQLAQIAPAARGAAAELTAVRRRPVPVDPATLEPTGPPFEDLEGVLAHYLARPGDGYGAVCGDGCFGRSGGLFAVVADDQAWRSFVAETGTVVRRMQNPDDPSRHTEVREVLEMGAAPGVAAWSPPPPGILKKSLAGHSALTDETFAYKRTGRLDGLDVAAAGRPAYRSWAIALSAGERLVRRRRPPKLPTGVEVRVTGTVPVYAVHEGWSLSEGRSPTWPTPYNRPAAWLLDALGIVVEAA
jgi:hypothetical protein